MRIEITDTLANMAPVDLVFEQKIRCGNANDGGYILVDILKPEQVVLSYGLGDNVSFDLDMAERGHVIYMFDHTIDQISITHSRFNYFPEGVGTFRSEDPKLHTIDEHLHRLDISGNNLILKMDVEGAEWDVLEEINEQTLCRFEQIVLELHDFAMIGDPAWCKRAHAALSKLARYFHVHHVHANNFAPIVVVEGIPVADVIELSLVRKDLAKVAVSQTLFPTALDNCNDVSRPDHLLSFFPWHPTATGRSVADDRMAYRALVRRIQQEQSASQLSASMATSSDAQPQNVPQVVAQGGGQPQRILLLSVHPVIEFSQIEIFEKLGHQVFSLGFYTTRGVPSELRPALAGSRWHDEMSVKFSSTGCRFDHDVAMRWRVTRDFISNFDVVIVDHDSEFIKENWAAFNQVPVVWRTIGNNSAGDEHGLRPFRRAGLKIVRWSPVQSDQPGYVGTDAVIRASADPNGWTGWVGDSGTIVTFKNDFRARTPVSTFELWAAAVEGKPAHLYGLRNDGIQQWQGAVSNEMQLEALRGAAAAFITGMPAAPYTLEFLEAWMLGVPIVQLVRQPVSDDGAAHAKVERFIVHGKNGFLVHTAQEARDVFDKLLADGELRARISAAGRASAIKHFATARISNQWQQFFNDMVGF